MADFQWLHPYFRLEKISQDQLAGALRAAGEERLDGYFRKGWHYPAGTEKAFYFAKALFEALGVEAEPDEIQRLIQKVDYDFNQPQSVDWGVETIRRLAFLCLACEVERAWQNNHAPENPTPDTIAP